MVQNRPFARNVATLVGGTAFAQGLMVLILPALTRLYSPADFEILAIYVALLSLINVISCLRLNIAIPLPESDRKAASLTALSVGSAVIISLVAALAITQFGDDLVRLLGKPQIAPYLWVIPVGTLFASVYMALQYWTSRKKRFGIITRTRISRSVAGATTQVGLGALAVGPIGLLVGQVIYTGMGSFRLAANAWSEDQRHFSQLNRRDLLSVLREYRRFPLLSVPEALFDSAGIQASILLIAAYSVGPEAGFMMLAMQVLGAPMALIGGAVAQVYLADASERMRQEELAKFTMKTIWSMLRLGGPILAATGVLAPFLFAPVFGSDWARAGEIVAMLSPSFLLQFLVSPVSMVLHVTGNVLTAMLLQAFGLALRAGAVFAAAAIAPAWIVESYAVSSLVYYVAYLVIVLLLIRRS